MKWQSAGLDTGYERHPEFPTRGPDERSFRRPARSKAPLSFPYPVVVTRSRLSLFALIQRCVSFHAATAVLILALFAAPASAQPAFPARGMEIVNALYAGVNPQDDTARRIAIIRTCEQMAAELGPNWGNKKRAGLPDDFRSPDSLAYHEADGSVSVWDIQASSGQITVFAGKGPDYPRLPPGEAAFMPCAPVNHLGPPSTGTPPPSTGQPPVVIVQPTPPPLDLSRVYDKLDTMDGKLDQHIASTEAFQAQARGIWDKFFQPVLEFTGKYIMPAVAAWFLGKEVAQP